MFDRCSAKRITTEITKLLTAQRSASPVRRTVPQCGVSAQNRSSRANSVVAAAETSREDYGKNCSQSLLHVLQTARAGTYINESSEEGTSHRSTFPEKFSCRTCFLFLLIRAFCGHFYIPLVDSDRTKVLITYTLYYIKVLIVMIKKWLNFFLLDTK